MDEINRKEYRIFRKNRDAFREYLKKSNVNLDTKWSDFLQVCKGHPAYQNMVGQPGSTCWQLFADYISSLRKDLSDDKKYVLKIIGDNKFKNVESLAKFVREKKDISYDNLNRIFDWLQRRDASGDTSDIDSESSNESMST